MQLCVKGVRYASPVVVDADEIELRMILFCTVLEMSVAGEIWMEQVVPTIWVSSMNASKLP